MNYDKIIADILRVEGGYVNDPTDRGGETNFGITITTARANGYTGPMKDMPESVAKVIYLQQYIVKPGFANIADTVSEALAAKLIDIGVNMGPLIAGQFLQKSLNLFQTDLAKSLIEDGSIGPATLAALNAFTKLRGAAGLPVLIKLVSSLQGARYADIATKNPSQRKYMYGWIANRV